MKWGVKTQLKVKTRMLMVNTSLAKYQVSGLQIDKQKHTIPPQA